MIKRPAKPSRLPGHKLIPAAQFAGAPGAPWKCECGEWDYKTPQKGPYGRTTTTARLVQVYNSHYAHLKSVCNKSGDWSELKHGSE